VSISAPDGLTTFNAELYAAGDGLTPAPAALILATRFEDWGGFPATLREAGFTALIVEIRTPLLVGDFRAVMDILSVQPSVNPAAIGVIGAEATADAALLGCAEDARCLTAVLLSPVQADPLIAALRGGYNPRPLLTVAASGSIESLRAADAITREATGERILQPLDGEWRGTQILSLRADLTTFIIDWLGRYAGG
jgi:hypothetical protein